MKQRGFTLMELIVVIAIIIILAGAMVPVFQNTTLRARISKATSEIDAIRSAVLAYNADTGGWPIVGTAGAGLIANTGGAGGAAVANWAGPYLQAWANDPWGTVYQLQAVPAGTANSRQAVSFGPNLAAGGADDITMVINP